MRKPNKSRAFSEVLMLQSRGHIISASTIPTGNNELPIDPVNTNGTTYSL